MKSKMPVWAPYVESILIRNHKIIIKYKGGECIVDPKTTLSLMIYGDTVDIPIDAFDILAKYGIPVIYVRRNLERTLWIHEGYRSSKIDVLTSQILIRQNKRKSRYIVRKLLEKKFDGMSWLIAPPSSYLKKNMSIHELMIIEAHHANRYWKTYYKKLGISDKSRREKTELGDTLNAVSKFVSSIILRWIHYHHLSPFHGFLHTTTDYPSLVYDLYEPYRGIYDKAVFDLYKSNTHTEHTVRLGKIINTIKEINQENIYCPQTKQIVARQELLHGIVLALRSYFLQETQYFIIPVNGYKNGGRPLKIAYKMPGRNAGISNIVNNTKIDLKDAMEHDKFIIHSS